MGRQAAVVLYVLAMVAIIVGVDVLFLRLQFWERLIVNVGIVVVFAAFYFEIPEASVRLCRGSAHLTGTRAQSPEGVTTVRSVERF